MLKTLYLGSKQYGNSARLFHSMMKHTFKITKHMEENSSVRQSSELELEGFCHCHRDSLPIKVLAAFVLVLIFIFK